LYSGFLRQFTYCLLVARPHCDRGLAQGCDRPFQPLPQPP
jgi:hypothetical protein